MTIQWHRSLSIDQSFKLPQWNCRGTEDFVAAHFFGNIFSEVREQLLALLAAGALGLRAGDAGAHHERRRAATLQLSLLQQCG